MTNFVFSSSKKVIFFNEGEKKKGHVFVPPKYFGPH